MFELSSFEYLHAFVLVGTHVCFVSNASFEEISSPLWIERCQFDEGGRRMTESGNFVEATPYMFCRSTYSVFLV